MSEEKLKKHVLYSAIILLTATTWGLSLFLVGHVSKDHALSSLDQTMTELSDQVIKLTAERENLNTFIQQTHAIVIQTRDLNTKANLTRLGYVFAAPEVDTLGIWHK